MYQLGVHFGILDWSFLPENINLCFSVFLLTFTHLPADSRSRKGWRKEIKPNGFLLSVRPSSSKTTVTMFNGSILREPIQKIWNISKAFATRARTPSAKTLFPYLWNPYNETCKAIPTPTTFPMTKQMFHPHFFSSNHDLDLLVNGVEMLMLALSPVGVYLHIYPWHWQRTSEKIDSGSWAEYTKPVLGWSCQFNNAPFPSIYCHQCWLISWLLSSGLYSVINEILNRSSLKYSRIFLEKLGYSLY